MAITFVGSNTQDTAGGLSLTFGIPGAAQSGDFMLAAVKQSENTTGREWDDDGGGGNGWTRLAYNRTTGGRDQETAIYYKIHDGAEVDPTFTWASGVTSEPMSGALLVYRGVDTTAPIQDWGWQWAQNDANPPNPSVSIGTAPSRVICVHNATHDDISSVAAPTGFTLRTQIWSGTANDHRNHFTADIEVNALGTYGPPDWQHSVLNTTPEYQTYTIALLEQQSLGITSTMPESTTFGSSLTLTGFGFEPVQGAGFVQIWSDLAGTIKQGQSVDIWADDEIQVTTSQGSLPNNATLYLVVTNDSGEESALWPINVGLLSYDLVIANQAPDHNWPLNNNYDDVVGGNDMTVSPVNGGGGFVTIPICEGSTHSWSAANARREAPNSANMNEDPITNRLMGGWIRLRSTQAGLACLYEEGGGVNNIAIFTGLGNVLIAQLADTDDDNVQAFSDFKLEVDRDYHIMFRYSYTDSVKEFRLYIDGALQAVTSGNPLTATDLDAHSGDISFGGPGGSLEVAGTNVLFNLNEDCLFAQWYTWSESKPESDILELFQRGARPTVTILSDTSENMQIALDALAGTVRPNAPLALRIEQPTDGTSLFLDADNITFDEAITTQLEWRGVGILTWTNLNGSDLISEKVYAALGGSVSIVNPAVLSLTGLQDNTEVRVYESGTTVEVAGQESVTTGVFSASIQVPSVDIVVHALGWLNQRLEAVSMGAGEVTLPIQQRVDRQYGNA